MAVLLLYQPLQKAAGTTFSGSLGLMSVTAALLVLVHSRRSSVPCRFAFLAGLLSGMAFAVRYALIPLVGAGCIYLWLESKDRVKASVSYGAGFLLIAAFVWARNIRLIGALMPEPNASYVSFHVNLKKTVMVLLRLTPDSIPSASALVLILMLMCGVIVLLLRQRRLISGLKSILIDDGRYLLPMFAAGYLCFLVIQRTRVHFDWINWRLVLPAGAVLGLIFAAALSHCLRISNKHRSILFSILLVALLVQQGSVAVRRPRFSPSVEISGSERLRWINDNTGPEDLIIGIDTVDVSFYLNRPSYSISAFPYCDYLTYDEVVRVCRSLDRRSLVPAVN